MMSCCIWAGSASTGGRPEARSSRRSTFFGIDILAAARARGSARKARPAEHEPTLARIGQQLSRVRSAARSEARDYIFQDRTQRAVAGHFLERQARIPENAGRILLKSCATPPASSPMLSSFCASRSRSSSCFRSVRLRTKATHVNLGSGSPEPSQTGRAPACRLYAGILSRKARTRRRSTWSAVREHRLPRTPAASTGRGCRPPRAANPPRV